MRYLYSGIGQLMTLNLHLQASPTSRCSSTSSPPLTSNGWPIYLYTRSTIYTRIKIPSYLVPQNWGQNAIIYQKLEPVHLGNTNWPISRKHKNGCKLLIISRTKDMDSPRMKQNHISILSNGISFGIEILCFPGLRSRASGASKSHALASTIMWVRP